MVNVGKKVSNVGHPAIRLGISVPNAGQNFASVWQKSSNFGHKFAVAGRQNTRLGTPMPNVGHNLPDVGYFLPGEIGIS